MEFENYQSISVLDRVTASFLVAFTMFIVSYTATRVYLSHSSEINIQTRSDVIPHPGSLWSDLGKGLGQ